MSSLIEINSIINNYDFSSIFQNEFKRVIKCCLYYLNDDEYILKTFLFVFRKELRIFRESDLDSFMVITDMLEYIIENFASFYEDEINKMFISYIRNNHRIIFTTLTDDYIYNQLVVLKNRQLINDILITIRNSLRKT